jgi:hypothetical protein
MTIEMFLVLQNAAQVASLHEMIGDLNLEQF